jgi:hypothetical protein
MLLTVEHWRQRAAHARTQAQFMSDPEAAQLLREIADQYDKIADRVRLVANSPPEDRTE